MKLHIFITKTLTFILLLSIYGCANMPDHIIIAPSITSTSTTTYNSKQVQLNVVDMRTSNHVVQIMRKDEAATVISAQNRLENTIKTTLITYWDKQNLSVNSSADKQINISIEKAIISVNQTTFEYESQTEIILKVVVNDNFQTLTMTFKNRGNSEGPLQADIAVLERNFNQRLSKLLQQILTNKKINDFLK